MGKEKISAKQFISLISMFTIGSSAIIGSGLSAKQDVWIAMLLAMLLALPMIIIYTRILILFPGKDLFEIAEVVLGKLTGKGFILLFTWYAFHLGALVIRNFSEFIQIVSIPETPQSAIVLLIIFLCIWVVKAGVEVLGRWSAFLFPLLLFFILGLVILSIPNMHFNFIRPILYNGFKPVLNASFTVFTFPFAETILFTTVLNALKEQDKILKVYLYGVGIAGITILLAAIRNILVLGPDTATLFYFPSYIAVSFINIGHFFQRIEVLISISFIFVGVVKVSICLYAASKGAAKILGISEHKKLVTPLGLLMLNFSLFVYKNVMEMFHWAKDIYPFYAIPFQIILPLILLMVAIIKKKGKSA